jgi:hypothetical protein
VDAEAEGEVFVWSSGQVQLVGVFKDSAVTVGCADAEGEQGACGVGLAGKLEFLGGSAVAELVAGFEAEEFVDGGVPHCMRSTLKVDF